VRSFIKKITPSFLLNIYRSFKKKQRLNNLLSEKKQGNIVTETDIRNKLSGLGINSGDTIMLHSSLSKIGYVDGGAQTVINALRTIVGETGTIMMPAFPGVGFNYDYLKTSPVFSLDNSPSKMGVITETFRKLPGVKRSLHPTDSVVALGPQSEFLTDTHFGQLTPYNLNSPFYKLCQLNGKIILLGVDFNSLTNLHTVEDAVPDFKFPVYHPEIFECEVIESAGKKMQMRTKVHDPKWSRKRKCNAMIPLFKQAGFLKEDKLGNAMVYVIEANRMHEWMVKSYLEKGITMYTPEGKNGN
jgi:aminoglycoside 3-N-acetyltransferase